MHERYACIRSAKKRLLVVIHYHSENDGGFYLMPPEIRRLGPWTDTRYGDVVKLKPEYRLTLAKQNYVLLEQVSYGWSPEVSSS